MSLMESDETQTSPLQETIGGVLASNLRKARERRGMSVRGLSERMADLSYPVVPTGITKAEHRNPKRRRRITADELCAVALALETSPADLLAPDPDASFAPVWVTPARSAFGSHVARWVRGEEALHLIDHGGQRSERERAFAQAAHHHVQRRWRTDEDRVVAAVVALEEAVRDVVDDQTPLPNTRRAVAGHLRRQAARVQQYVALLADELEHDGEG